MQFFCGSLRGCRTESEIVELEKTRPAGISRNRFCTLMGVCRSRFYYEKKGERFWRSIKQDYIYLNPTADVKELRSGIDKWIRFYNYERPHQGLKGNVPTAVYMEAA